jgi:hypothetical protein
LVVGGDLAMDQCADALYFMRYNACAAENLQHPASSREAERRNWSASLYRRQRLLEHLPPTAVWLPRRFDVFDDICVGTRIVGRVHQRYHRLWLWLC